MPNTPINIYDLLVNRRAIRKNFSDQIISYTLPSDSTLQYGLKRIPAKTVFYQTEKYNDVIDLTSDELINDISDLQPTVVSNNFVDLDLVLSDAEIQQQQQLSNTVEMVIYGDGNNNYIDQSSQGARRRLIETLRPAIAPPSIGIPSSQWQHVLEPFIVNASINKSVYYIGQLTAGTQLYTDSSTTTPYVGTYSNNYVLIKSFDELKDSDLSTKLNAADDDLLQKIVTDAQGTGWNSFPNIRNEIKSNWNNATNTGGILQINQTGEIINIFKLTGDWNASNQLTNPSPNFIQITNIT
tara:strand:- start:55585 stop:56475 length:891 start_codon:yes stop_codon:yes gene_type:complete